MSTKETPKITVIGPERGTSSQLFKDAMVVRTEVFIIEQLVPAENEIDLDDERSLHWVAYSDGAPVGTIRLVPSPHPPHGHDHMDPAPGSGTFIKLGRLATLKTFRGLGIGRVLVDAALVFARENPTAVGPRGRDVKVIEGEWDGRCLVHAQTIVKGMWAKSGFVVDAGMGEWDEEGIMHVGMWKDITVPTGV